MRDMKRTSMKMRRMMQMVMLGKQEMMLRRGVNRIAHVLTPHGKIVAGRKGRKG